LDLVYYRAVGRVRERRERGKSARGERRGKKKKKKRKNRNVLTCDVLCPLRGQKRHQLISQALRGKRGGKRESLTVFNAKEGLDNFLQKVSQLLQNVIDRLL